jgi:hypothetical protein
MIVIVVGFVTPAFTTLIVNLVTPVIAYLVYKNYVILGLQRISNENKEEELKEGVV